MATGLAKMFQSGDVETLAAKIWKLEKKQVALTAELKIKGAIRRENALAAAEGEPKATAALNTATAEAATLRARLDDLDLAIGEASQRLSAARESAADDERRAEIQAQGKDLADRLNAVKDAEDALRALDRSLKRMEDFGVQIEERYRNLMPGERPYDHPFERRNVEVRLMQFAFGIGLTERVSVLARYVNSAAPQRDFVETEAEAQSFYGDLERSPADEPLDHSTHEPPAADPEDAPTDNQADEQVA